MEWTILRKLRSALIRVFQFYSKKKTPQFLSNVFRRDYKRKVLFSYLTEAFQEKRPLSHTCYTECFEFARVFDELGYQVDVVHLESTKNLNIQEYEVLFGMGDPYERFFLSPHLADKTTIWYGTGCFPDYSNTVTLERIKAFRRKKGSLLPESGRIITSTRRMSTMLSDALIILGNDFTLSTYATSQGKKYLLDLFYHQTTHISPADRNYAECKYHFLWFGSNGLIHKGLDILLDIFKDTPSWYLHVCGANPYESRFLEIYQQELFHCPNIFNYGKIDIESKLFETLMMKCGFVIFPSISEGGCASVLTVMGNGGLIPIISKQCGLNVENCGILFDNMEHETVKKAIEQALLLGNEQLLDLSKRSIGYAQTVHSLDRFKVKAKEIVQDVLQWSK